MLNVIAPHGSYRRRSLKKALHKVGIKKMPPTDHYQIWFSHNKDNINLYKTKKLNKNPLISIVVPAFNTPDKYLQPLIASITSQTYSNWELVLVNASTDSRRLEAIKNTTNIDSRIKVVCVDNKGISANTNKGINEAEGEYVAFADHDDTLEPDALYEIVKAICNNPEAGLLYTDEDKITDKGNICLDPHFKPDWSPDLITNVNYITHFVVVKKELALKVGMLDSSRDGAQDYDFLLKVIDTGAQVVHIPKILYHWRMADSSTAQDFSSKPNIVKSGKSALEDHLKRNNLKGEVQVMENRPGFYKVKYQPIKNISLIIPPFLNKACMELYTEILLRRTSTEGVQIIIPAAIDFEEKYAHEAKVKKVDSMEYEEFMKQALEMSNENIIIVNKIAFPESDGWINEMSGLLGLERVSAASPIIVNTDREIEDCGLVGESRTKLFESEKLHSNTYFGNTEWTRNVDGLTGACLFLRKSELLEYTKGKPISQSTPTNYTYSVSESGRFNTVWAHTVFGSTFPSLPDMSASKYFNPNLYRQPKKKDDWRVYSSEEQTINFLLYLRKAWFNESV